MTTTARTKVFALAAGGGGCGVNQRTVTSQFDII